MDTAPARDTAPTRDTKPTDVLPTPRERLEQLLPPAPPLDTATLGTGLGDAAARESVARLLTRTRRAA